MQKFIVFIALFIVSVKIVHGQQTFTQKGEASYYDDKFSGRYTASGEKYNPAELTGAHLTLPFNSYVKVTNLTNSKSVVIRINDRGPFIKGRILDVSKSAAYHLGMLASGKAQVRIELVDASQFVKLPVPPEILSKTTSMVISADTEKAVTPVNSQPNIATESVTVNSTGDQENPTTVNFYSMDIHSHQPSGYGVQIASYRESANLIRLGSDLKERYNEEVIVQVASIDKDRIYRVIIGDFPNRREAEKLKKKIEDDYPQCYIFDYTKKPE